MSIKKFCFLLGILFLPYFVSASTDVAYFGATIPAKYYDELVRLCTMYSVPIVYAARLIEWESRWNPECITKNPNGSKDLGLMKNNSLFIKESAFRYNKGIKYDPLVWKDNMRIGIQHLSTMRKHTGSWIGAIIAYNMGLTGFKEWRENKRIMPEGTKLEIEFVFG